MMNEAVVGTPCCRCFPLVFECAINVPAPRNPFVHFSRGPFIHYSLYSTRHHCLSSTDYVVIAGGGNNIAQVVTLGAYATSFSVSAIILRALLVIHCLYLHCLYLTDYVIYRHLSQGWGYYCSVCGGNLFAGVGILLSRLRRTVGDSSLLGSPTSTPNPLP